MVLEIYQSYLMRKILAILWTTMIYCIKMVMLLVKYIMTEMRTGIALKQYYKGTLLVVGLLGCYYKNTID
jgi:hypothetical protein